MTFKNNLPNRINQVIIDMQRCRLERREIIVLISDAESCT